ncbi:sugar phosphate isomerase [Paenibacillus baekrokdamisoli]|uniref:Sugar phosphate isomerase n=1 Tax=Paenibacillus baekrokdamisoli TaxID=1712516 RepID=A0A3G9J905_9BACL|nr:sugar phosphate isomerase/epimerase [Paenibacillus baekrokdamisoli]MBB3072047.1 sugar phosphate isomerase/epimerase [Paenibacillus baekrokdamisoli]BBH20348.1 sugar phosphate isomerase [Paenibacillus baekrokdamisoli]
MNASIGLQAYSVREEWDKDILGTLERLAEIGYKNLELAITNTGDELLTGGLKADELRKELDRLGMKAVSTHVYPLNNANWERIVDFNQEVGSSAIVYPIHYFSNLQDVHDLSANMNKWGEICLKHGMNFYFHNHFHEFQPMGGQTIMDRLLDNTDENLVKIELDTYWAMRGGVDPIEYLRKLGSRCDLVHQKDVPATTQPLNLLELVGTEEVITEQRFSEFWKAEDFTEIGDGIMDIGGILRVIQELGFAKYVFVEQDMTSLQPLDSVQRSYSNFSKLWQTV